jgi:hypothetical protein
MMFPAKYLSSSSFGFLKEDFKVFTIYIEGKSMTPRAGPFLTPGLFLNKLGRHSSDNVSCQVFKL